MTLRCLLVFVICAAPSIAAPVPKELKHRPDSQRMQGVWMSHNPDGSPMGRWYFTGEKLFAGGSNTTDQKGYEYAITLRPGSEQAEFDLATAGSMAFLGIYKFAGEELHVAYRSGADRAKSFETGSGGHHHILRRLPEGKK